jgi:hypothetical protein
MKREYFYQIVREFMDWCKRHGLSLRTAAFMAKISPGHLVDIGKRRRNPSGNVIRRMLLSIEKDKECEQISEQKNLSGT